MSLKTLFKRPSGSPFAQLSRRMRVALVVGFVCAGAMLLVNESAHVQTASALQSVRVANGLLTTVNTLLRELSQAESAQRGYVLTADTAYLTPYRRSKQEVEAQVRQLDAAVALESDMRQQAAELTKAVSQKFGEMELTIRLHEQKKMDAVNFVVSTNVGLDEMERIRGIGTRLIASATSQVERGRQEVFRLLDVTRFGLAAGILAALFAFVLYTQQTRQMQRNDEEYNRSLEAERDALESQVQERTARLTELANHLQQAVEDERAHLARELHDELGALLTAAKLDVARLKSRLPPDAPELITRLKHLTETLNQGIALKRRIIEDLRPSSLSNLGLVASLDILLREFGERSRLEIESALEPVDLNESSDLTIYRMVQESLEAVAQLMTVIEASLDFPEDDIPQMQLLEIGREAGRIATDLHRAASEARRSRVLWEGASVAIVGRPNVGKSRLLNALLREERAIVSDRPGTTRDTVSEVANIRGIPIQLIDTAGMREAVDPLERIGVERARGALADADIALAVIDGSMPLAPEDLEIVMSTPEHRTAVVISKSDLPEAFAGEDVGGRVGNRRVLRVSALTGSGIDQLEAEIEALAVAREVDFGETAQSFGARRADCLGRAANALDEVARATGEGVPPDMLSIDLRVAIDALGEIMGQTAREDIIDRIFEQFCVGK